MSVTCKRIPTYFCKCDVCGRTAEVKQDENNYNGAQAVRSLRWSFGKFGAVKCDVCRKNDWNDHYQYR